MTDNNAGAGFMLNWDYLDASVDKFAAEWRDSQTIRHVVIENFLEPGYCERLRNDFTVLDYKLKGDISKKHKHVRGKAGTGRSRLTELQNAFFDEINSPRALEFMSRLTGIRPLYGDDDLFGGGPHGIRTGGYLNVHTDFNFHPKTSKHRRLNILLYLNPRWEDEWNGHIELWRPDLAAPILKLQPIINRVLMFETSEHSFHGHPWPLRTPPDVVRCSLAAYYYSEWPEGVQRRPQTNYQLVPQQWAALIKDLSELGVAPEALERSAIEALETGYQTGDIRTAVGMLLPLTAKYRIPMAKWAEIFSAISGELSAGRIEKDEVIAGLAGRYPENFVDAAYRRLRALRSVATVGEVYTETVDGKLATRKAA